MTNQEKKIVSGQKHLVQCRCFLPHLKNLQNPPNHSFVVFSLINDDESVVEKYSQCNNCGVIHRVYDLCKSEILSKEKNSSIITEKDIAMMIPSSLSELLLNYSCDISVWEQAHFIVSYQRWGESIVITKETSDGVCNGKKLTIQGLQQMKIESFSYVESF
jgi:hypothetical protein